MADDYQDLVELGFEGVNTFAHKYHDAVYGYAGKHKSKWHRRKDRGTQPDPPLPRVRSECPHGSDSSSDTEERPRKMYAPDRKREREWRDDGGRDGPYARPGEEQDYNPAPATGPVVMRDGYPYRYPGSAAARAPSPSPYGYAPAPYGDAWTGRGRSMPVRRRSSSWSPPRRSDQRRYDSPPRRVRSKSPNHHRVAATVVGALAGGLAGSRFQKGEPVTNTVTTVAGAIIGGLGAREIEKVYDRRKDREAEEEERREERRQRRRERERERRYD